MIENIPESAKSVQSVFDNINALNEDFSNNTQFSRGLKKSQRLAKGIFAHYKNKELLFGLARMVGFEGMTPEKYTEFKKGKENRYVFRQVANRPREFRQVTQRNREFMQSEEISKVEFGKLALSLLESLGKQLESKTATSH